MSRFALALLVTSAIAAGPANAAVLGAANVALGTAPTTFTLNDATFSFSYDAAKAAVFDYMPYSVQTGGTGETSAFFGQPSPFDQRGITIDGNLFPSFAAIPTSSPIPYSLVAEDLALRYSTGADFYYGYARLNGDGTLDIAFESVANTAITAGATITGPLGAVPEPATWIMMIAGFGLAGATLRQQRRGRVRFA